MTNDETYMGRCFELARQGLGRVSPNPLVGCVIVHQEAIIGEGYHLRYGGKHAEVNAIDSVRNKDLLRKSTLYVNLEPCVHFGKTPPCADLVIQSGILRVVIANEDPNPLVSGRGIHRLSHSGVELVSGICRKEGGWLNRRFFTFHREKRPYIILKWAKTLDGFIDIDRTFPGANKSNWITNDFYKRVVHQWRAEEDAVMVGTDTALNDNPQLTVREVTGRNPLRIVIDEKLSLPHKLSLFDGSTPTVVFTAGKAKDKTNIQYITLDFSNNILPPMLEYLYNSGIQSLMVEGGKKLLESFIEAGFWDEARVLEGNKTFGKGLKGPDIEGELISRDDHEGDRLLIFRKQG